MNILETSKYKRELILKLHEEEKSFQKIEEGKFYQEISK